ncbi:hypothetical protein Rs2_44531 [Raphanus sativus]|nr:hypothetical protein Rs2_44531 [Raphanus sativus]
MMLLIRSVSLIGFHCIRLCLQLEASFRLLSINRNEVSLAPLQTIFVDFHGQIRGDREEQVGGLQKDLSSAMLCRRRDRAIGSSDYVSLLREEVEKDLTASVRKKHLLENKKRPKTVQKQIIGHNTGSYDPPDAEET